jgi:hypothetical protein
MTEWHKGINNTEGLQGRITISEAAALLGVHPNTVRKRVKQGIYNAEKISTENGFTWIIDRNSLINNTIPKASQKLSSQAVNPQAANPIEIVQDLLRPFVEDLGRVREALGAERVRREQAEQERDELRRQLEALQDPRDAPETATLGVGKGDDVPPAPQKSVQRLSQLARFFFRS